MGCKFCSGIRDHSDIEEGWFDDHGEIARGDLESDEISFYVGKCGLADAKKSGYIYAYASLTYTDSVNVMFNGDQVTTIPYEEEMESETMFPVNYCPFCGEKLTDGIAQQKDEWIEGWNACSKAAKKIRKRDKKRRKSLVPCIDCIHADDKGKGMLYCLVIDEYVPTDGFCHWGKKGARNGRRGVSSKRRWHPTFRRCSTMTG